MNKLLSSVGLAITFATVSMLAGCQLYFGSSNGSGSGTSGPGGGGGGGGGTSTGSGAPGNQCSADGQCASGCFCSDGVCTEAGFCATDKDCGNGFHCDVNRSSCVPDAQCTANEQCAPGSMCDPAVGSCVTTCKCTSDADAVRQGAGWCDETRGTCMPGTDPAGTCTAALTCTNAPPSCPENQVPLVKDGCFTGKCRAITVCEAPPVCKALQHQDDCAGRTADCSSVFTGHSCHGTTCGVSPADCVCDSYTFAACEDKGPTPTRIIVDGN